MFFSFLFSFSSTYHITVDTILMMTSNTALKKSITIWPFSPRVPKNVPNTKQKKTMPSVLVPLLYCVTLINSSSPRTSEDIETEVRFWKGGVFGTYTVWAWREKNDISLFVCPSKARFN